MHTGISETVCVWEWCHFCQGPLTYWTKAEVQLVPFILFHDWLLHFVCCVVKIFWLLFWQATSMLSNPQMQQMWVICFMQWCSLLVTMFNRLTEWQSFRSVFVLKDVVTGNWLTFILVYAISSYIYTRTQTHNCLTDHCLGLPGPAGTRRNIHPLTPILITSHTLSTSSIYYDV